MGGNAFVCRSVQEIQVTQRTPSGIARIAGLSCGADLVPIFRIRTRESPSGGDVVVCGRGMSMLVIPSSFVVTPRNSGMLIGIFGTNVEFRPGDKIIGFPIPRL